MNRVLLLVMLLIPGWVMAHGGEDHGAAPASHEVVSQGSSAFAVSDKYEVLLKYEGLEKNTESTLRLYISEFHTNKPVDDATITVVGASNNQLRFSARHVESGIYDIKGVFPDNGPYSLNVIIQAGKGPDMLVLENVQVGNHMLSGSPLELHKIAVAGLAGVVMGAAVVLFIMLFRRKKGRPEYAAFAIILLSLPLSTSKTSAHGAEAHEGVKAGAPMLLTVPKETQFLYGIETSVNKYGDFCETREFQGEIIPGQNGLAVIESPQSGKIVSLNVVVGQVVKRGQEVATIEQTIDAATQLNMLTQFNSLSEEVKAAKLQFERLKSISDITSKRELSEAESRYRIARKNLEVLRQNLSAGSANRIKIKLTAPIGGVVGPFSFAVGSMINAGEALFNITDLRKVLVAVQVDAQDVGSIEEAKQVAIRSEDGSATGILKKVSAGQSVNEINQTHRYLFEIRKQVGEFKLGQKVIVASTQSKPGRELITPNQAIVEVNGKAAYFVKDGPETFHIKYTKAIRNNGTETVVTGAKEGDRIVSAGSYEMKTMFLNQ